MRREAKRRRFNDAVVDMLFPQPTPQPPPQSEEEEKELVNELREDFDADLIPDDLEESGFSTSDDNGDDERGPEKLTRAQRKKLRKRKLKEDASRRGKIIGPLLPSTGDECGSGGGDAVLGEEPPAVRYNAADKELDVTVDKSGEEPNTCPRRHAQPHTPSHKDTPGEKGECANQKKLKQRRIAKRVAKERLKSSNAEKCNQN